MCNSKYVLETLKGASSEIGQSFYCFDNKLTTLEHCPSEIGGDLECDSNLLTDLNISSVIGGDIYCDDNKINKYKHSFYGEVGGKVIFE